MIPFIVLSYRRPWAIQCTYGFPSERLKICVTESEAEAYKATNPDIELIVHPDSVVGLPATRQWLYEKVGTCFMLDDDIRGLINMEACGPRHTSRKLSRDEAAAVLDRLIAETQELGVFLCEVNSSSDPTNYNDFKPYRLSGMVRGGCTGIIEGSKLFWNKRALQEDVWLSALNAFHHRMALIDCRYAMDEKAENDLRLTGGLSVFRTEEALMDDKRWLQSMFGKQILSDRDKHMGPASNKPDKKDKRSTRSKRVSPSQFSYRDPFV